MTPPFRRVAGCCRLVFRKNARAKSGLNKAILDQGWFAFLQMLDYKLAWSGG